MKLSKLEKPFLLVVLSLITLSLGGMLIMVIFVNRPVAASSWVPHVPKPLQQIIIRSQRMVSGLAQAVVPEALSSLVNDPPPAIDDNIPLPPGSGYDVGFRAKPQGFSFHNYGNREPDGNLTIQEVEALFGKPVCAHQQAGACVPLPEAQLWIDSMNGYMAAGHCAGFTIAAMRLYGQELQAHFFTPDSKVTFDIQQNKPAMGQIAKDWVLQTFPEVAQHQVDGTPRQIIQKLLELGQAVDLGIFNRSGGGHSLLAYGVKDKGNGMYDILVYDNNWPGQDLAIQVDYKANTWRYSIAATNPSEDPKAWEGDAQTQSLIFMPFSAYNQKVACPFCTQTDPAEEKLAIAMSGDQALPEVTTENGQRIGQFGGETINEVTEGELRKIKDAMYNDRAPFLRLPMTTNFNLVMKPRPEFEMATTNLRMMGPGLAFAILNAQIPQGGLAGLQVSPLNQAFAYTPAMPNANPIMQIATTRNGVSTIATVAVNGTGSPINLSINPQGGALQIGGVSGNVTLVVATVNANGTTNVFAQANMPVQAGTTVALNVGEWNGTGPMPVSIAQGNGTFVPATPLTNQPLSQVVVALGNGPAIINTLNGIAPYLNSNQVNQIVQGLTQINLSGQVLGQIVLGLTLPLSPNQAAALISNLPPVQMAQFFAAAQLSEEMISQIIAAMNLSPTAAAALQTQITRLMELENLLLEIEYNNFQTTGELQAYLEQHGGLTQAELEYIQAELVFNGNSQAILLQPIIAALTPTPEPPTPFPATATPMASGVAATPIPATVAPSATVPAPTATPESGSSSGGSSGGSDVKTATPTKESAATPTTTLPTATATAQTGATATPQTGTATPQPGTPTNTPAPSLALGPVGQPLHGKVVLVNNDTGLQYIPEAHFYGSDSFTYTVKGYASTRRLTRQTAPSLDLSLPENTPALDVPIMPNPNANDLVVTVNLSVTNVNDDPLAVADVVTITENSSVTITILANDTYLPDPPETLAITEMGVPSHGQAVLVAETVYYTPTLHFVGTDSLTYSIADGNGGTATGIISLTVTNINEAPFFVSSPPLMATEDVTYSYLIDTNDFDLPYGDSLTLAAITHPTWLTLIQDLQGLQNLAGLPTNDDIGSHNIVLQVTDSTGLTATQAFSIMALNINTPPTFVSTPPLTATQDIAYSYALGATDPDTIYGDFPTFSLIAAPTWLALNGGVLSGIPTNNDVGLANVVLRVTDMGGLTETQSYTLTIENVNDAPQFVSTPTLYGVQDFTYTYVISTSDIDEIYGDTMQVSLISAPAWLSLTQDPQGISNLTGLPTNSDVGTTTITLQVADSTGLTATQVFSLYIDDLNDLPVNTTPLTQTVQEDNALVLSAATSNQVSVADADIALMPFTVSLTINDGTLSLSQTTGLTFTQGTGLQDTTMTFQGEIAAVNAALATLTYSPTLDFNGVAYLTLVSDDRGTAFGGPVNVTNIITVNVMAVNDPPTQTLPSALTMDEDTPTPFAISVADVDATSMQVSLNTVTGSLTLADSSGVTLVNNGAAMTVTGTVADLNRVLSNITYHPALNITGTFNLDVTTTDLGFTGSGGELMVNGTIPITINSLNDAPINTVPTVMLNMFEDSPLTFSVASGFPIQVEDADSDDAPIEVKFNAYHGTVQLTTTANLTVTIDTQSYFIMTLQGTVTALNQALSVVTYTPKVNFTGPTVLQMSTSDLGNSGSGGVLTDLDDINITVNVNNDTPIFVASPSMLTVENTLETFVYTATALDINPEDTLTFFAPTLPSWLTMTNHGNRTATISGTPAISHTGLHLVELTINDGRLTSLTQAFTITVWNAAPTFVSTPVLSVYQNITYTYNISTTDIEGNPLTMTATTLPSWLTFLDNGDGTAVLSGTPIITNGGTVGAHNTVLEVSDSVSTTQQSFAITVMPPNTVVDILADVDNADSSPGDNSLREALRYANAGDTITFDPVITGGTITLSSELLIDKDLTISGTVPINISGNNAVRVFDVGAGATNITLEKLTIMNGNAATGAGINVTNAANNVIINDSTFTNNNATWGGGLSNNGGTVTISNSTFTNNTGTSDGGALLNVTNGTMTIANSTFVNNSSANGGGLQNYEGTATVKNSTFSGNSTSSNGAGINNRWTLHLYNTIVANSTAGNDCVNTGTIATNTNNLIETGSCSGAITSDPQLGPLQNNGGTTMTLAPLPGSPAINAGNNATCLTLDQIGTTRPTSGTYWNQCDMGAVEFIRPTKNLLVDITADEIEVTNGVGDNSLREAIFYSDPGDTITFDAAVSGGTITLGSQLTLDRDLTISGTVPINISGNNAVRVFHVTSGIVTFTQLTIVNGNTTSLGAGINVSPGANLIINDTTIANNSTTSGGGGINSDGTLTINRSTIVSNTAGSSGGGIWATNMTINNSTIANNTGQGVNLFSGSIATINNSTIASNSSIGFVNNGTLHLKNTIIANNSTDCSGIALATNTNNLIETGNCSGAITSDPQLGPLQNNGGTTMTLAPLPGSPAINAGNNATCLSSDQTGMARPTSGTYWNQCDIGAVEFIRPTKNLLVDITADEIEVTNAAGDNSLREAIFYSDPGDTITFDAAVSGGTITLGSQLTLDRDLTISGTVPITISGNNAVRVFDVAASITNVLMDGLNVINGNASGGAALRNGTGSSVTINNSTFANHQSTAGAGAISSFGATLAINNSTFHNNSASGNAGAIDGSGTLTIQNSTFANNSATNNGGAVAFSGPTLTTKNSTFSGNNAANGRTLYLALGSAHIYNTIMANGTGGGSECTGVALTTNTNNLIEDGSCSPAFSGDPMLGPLQNNGGTTMSMALLTGSPAANTGNNATCLTTDQRGIARPIGSNCDIGAYETDLAPIAGHFNGLNLDGVDNYIQLPANAALNFNGAANLSVEMWIKTTGTGLMLFGKPGTINGNVQYVFWVNGSGMLGLNMDQQTGAGWSVVNGTTAVNTGAWTHVAFAKSGCNISFYVNGVAAGSGTMGGAQCSSTSSTNQANFFAPFFGGYFNGQADEIRLWNVARTQGEIQANMGRTLIGDEAGLLGYWRLEEGSGTIVNDTTANGLQGTLQNFVAADWIKSTQTVGPAWRILSNATLTNTLPSYEPDGQSITYTIVSNGSQGVATITDANTGAFTYVPNSGASGVDTFTYKVNDGTNDSVIQTATIEFINVVVSTLADTNDSNYSTGQNSLREAIANAPAGSTITFDASLSGQTITLSGSELQINKSLTISGNVPITINGNNASRVLNLLTGSSTITLENLTLRNGNTDGAAIYNNTNTVTLNNVTIRNNTMVHAAIYNWAGTLNINNSTIISNTATGAAGGLYNAIGATVNINNSTIANNTSYDGGGIRNFGTMTIQNSTISGNSASNSGGGVSNAGTLTMRNSIVANSPAGGDCVGSITTNLNNLIKDGSCSPALTGDPLLGPLQNNGGATMTMLPSACSPVINAGGATSLTSDQVGNPRVVGAAVDIGAVEHQTAATLLMTVQNNSDTAIAPIGSLREAICAVAVGGTVNFAAGLSGQTITLASELVINKSLTISGNVPIIISGNNASRVFNLGASATSVTFDGLTIANGNAGAANGGGGIAVSSAVNTVTINNSTLTNNTAGYGGAIWNGLGTVTINRSTFLTNSATSWEGGAIYNQISGSILTINDSTFYGNSGSTAGGGGIFNNSTATVNNSTFANNVASSSNGGGILNNGGATLNLKNTIIANSTGSDCYNLGTIVTNINNLIQDRTCNVGTTLSGYISGPPNLGPLQNNGGSTLTLAPLANSAALSRGDSGTCLTSDQTGLARPQPITDTTCDIGAVESSLLSPGPGPFAYIPNRNSNDMSVIDTSVNAVVKTIPVGTNPLGAVVTPDGTRIYVGNATSNNISVIDTSSNTVLTTISLGASAYGLAVTPDGKQVYVVNSGGTTVQAIDTNSNIVIATITVGTDPQMVAITPDGTRAYVANAGSNNVSVIDTTSNTVVATISVGTYPRGVAVSPDGSRVYVADRDSTNVNVISTSSNTVIAAIALGGTNHQGIVVSPDGTRAYVANRGGSIVRVINTGTNAVIGTITVGTNPIGLAMTPDGSWLYVVNQGSNNVSIVDTSTNTVVGSPITIGTSPYAMGNFITPYPQISSAVVDTVTDNGFTTCTATANDCSLRGAIARLSAGGTITFDPSLSGQTITLGSALGIYKNMTISSSVPINISGNNNSRVFYIGAGTVTLDSLTIMNGNTGSTTPGGGLFINTGANLTINNSTLINNTASEGGAIINVGALTINNSTFYNNTSMGNSGGAIYHAGSSLAINNSTIANNSGVMNGGIYSINTMSLKNTLIANNTGNTNADCWNNGGTIAANVNNLIETGNCSGSITTDPNLGALANNSGNTQTMALGAGSPAIDAGDFATCLATDQRGTARGASQCDIGAYEYNTASRPKPATKVYLPIVVRK